MLSAVRYSSPWRAQSLVAGLCVVLVVCASCGTSSSESSTETTTPILPVEQTGSFATESTACPGISIYPSPDTAMASPTTQISLRNVSSDRISASTVEVSGSETGPHEGRVVADSDGEGASFFSQSPFSPGETVTVSAPGQICGADGRSAEFSVAHQNMHALPEDDSPPRERPETTESDLQHFVSDPALEPPVLEVDKAHPDGGEGSFFLGAKGGTLRGGPMIVDGNGNLVWYHQVPEGVEATDVRVAEFKGEPVLTWWQGSSNHGNGAGKGIIADQSYETIATVEAGNGFDADLHEFRLEPDGTAWLTAYAKTPADLTSMGGPENAPVFDGIVQQIDVATGNVLFEWHSLDHVDLSESEMDYSATDSRPYDYFHVNSIEADDHGTVLVSARNTSSVYLLNRATGAVIWTLGGKNSDFDMGDGTKFKFQHDARFRGDHHVTIFDNQTDDTPGRLLALSLDLDDMAASVAWDYTAPGEIPIRAQGNLQLLENGNIVAGWGSSNKEGPTHYTSTITEYTQQGDHLFVARFKGEEINTYRAFRARWSGKPKTSPAAKVTDTDDGTAVALSWNGATGIESWDLVTTDANDQTEEIAQKDKSGFETKIPVTDLPSGTMARALGKNGRVLATVKVNT